MTRDETRAAPAVANGHPAECVRMLVIGAGRRGRIYSNYAKEHPDSVTIVGAADLRPHRLARITTDFNLSSENAVRDWHDLARRPKFADAVMICLLDRDHLEAVRAFAALGYDVLCEKPMAVLLPECLEIANIVHQTRIIFGVGHVLRYSPYNLALKEVLDSGAIGDIINIQHIEPIGFEHFAHSYVRGNWKKESESSSSLMAKSCHDLDILGFYLSGPGGSHKERNFPVRVSSFGSLSHFKPSNKPAEAQGATRCTECPYESKCPYSAKRNYLDQFDRPHLAAKETRAERFLDTEVLSPETILPHLENGPYGECVYNGQNDVCDNQVVNIEYASGITASFTMIAFTDSETECNRRTRIFGTRGQIEGDMQSFSVYDFVSKSSKTYHPKQEGIGHGGGDFGVMRAFIAAVSRQKQSALGVDVDDILHTHLLVFAAEEARKTGTVVDFKEYLGRARE